MCLSSNTNLLSTHENIFKANCNVFCGRHDNGSSEEGLNGKGGTSATKLIRDIMISKLRVTLINSVDSKVSPTAAIQPHPKPV
jgi:hypothetical protein